MKASCLTLLLQPLIASSVQAADDVLFGVQAPPAQCIDHNDERNGLVIQYRSNLTGKEIMFAGPSTISSTPAANSISEYALQMRLGAALFIEWVSLRGGICVNGEMHGASFTFVDDEASPQLAAWAAAHVIDDLGADFVFGGYSSGLTAPAADVAWQRDKIFMSSGAGSTAIFKREQSDGTSRNQSFSMVHEAPDSLSLWLQSIVDAAEAIDAYRTGAAAATVSAADGVRVIETSTVRVALGDVLEVSPCDGVTATNVTCRDHLKVGIVALDVPVFRYFAGVLLDAASALGIPAEVSTLSLTRNTADRDAELDVIVQHFVDTNVTVLIGCAYLAPGIAIVERLSARRTWTPLATMLTQAIDQPEYTSRVFESQWWQGLYVVGQSAWLPELPGAGELTGLTALEFYELYYSKYTVSPGEQAAGQFAAGVVLVNAIERSGSLGTADVLEQLSMTNLATPYGTISFKVDSHMNGGTAVVGQLIDAEGTSRPNLVYPLKVGGETIINAPLHFPTPTWRTRECDFQRSCGDNGACDAKGTCSCHADFTGDKCEMPRQPNCPAEKYADHVASANVSACDEAARQRRITLPPSTNGCPSLGTGTIGCRHATWDELTSLMVAALALATTFHLATIVHLVRYRKRPNVSRLQPFNTVVCVVGAVVIDMSVLLIPGHRTRQACVGYPVILSLGMGLVVLPLFVRQVQTWHFFTRMQMASRRRRSTLSEKLAYFAFKTQVAKTLLLVVAHGVVVAILSGALVDGFGPIERPFTYAVDFPVLAGQEGVVITMQRLDVDHVTSEECTVPSDLLITELVILGMVLLATLIAICTLSPTWTKGPIAPSHPPSAPCLLSPSYPPLWRRARRPQPHRSLLRV